MIRATLLCGRASIPCTMGNPEIANGRQRRRARSVPRLDHGVAYARCGLCDFQVPWPQRKHLASRLCMYALAPRVALLAHIFSLRQEMIDIRCTRHVRQWAPKSVDGASVDGALWRLLKIHVGVFL